MRPERADIAAPVLPGRIRWLNASEPPNVAALTATGPLLVHFFDFAQLNSVRALPYLLEWRRRYEPLGVSFLGVHSPRFGFTSDAAALDAGIAARGIAHPVADDSQYSIWHDYGCKGWPSLFLWGRGGALRWFHFGEGEYRETEDAIAEELRSEDVTLALPEPLEPMRPQDAPGALVAPPSAELFPGGSPGQPWIAEAGELVETSYEAGSVYAVADGEGVVRWSLDGAPVEQAPVPAGGLIELAEHPRHEAHALSIGGSAGVRIWALSFGAGLP